MNVIKSLIDHNHREFDSDPALMNNFTSFMEVVESTGLQKIASQLKLLIEKKVEFFFSKVLCLQIFFRQPKKNKPKLYLLNNLLIQLFQVILGIL